MAMTLHFYDLNYTFIAWPDNFPLSCYPMAARKKKEMMDIGYQSPLQMHTPVTQPPLGSIP